MTITTSRTSIASLRGYREGRLIVEAWPTTGGAWTCTRIDASGRRLGETTAQHAEAAAVWIEAQRCDRIVGRGEFEVKVQG